MKNTYKEIRIIDMDELRSLCIKKGWYTRGTNEEYSKMLNKVHEDGFPLNMTTERIADIAVDIYQHSEISDYDETSIMYAIARACSCCFERA